MSFTERFQSWTDIIKNIVIIGGIVLAILWGGLSIYAHVTQNNPANPYDIPAIEKARYQFLIQNTGRIVYANAYDVKSAGSYTLKGYYSLDGDKYSYYKADLTLSEKYFGKITITDRRLK